MLPKIQIKQHTKYAVWSHFISCFLVMITASLIPTLVSNAAMSEIVGGIDITNPDFDVVAFFTQNADRFFIAELISLFALIINLPFEYCLIRYFFVLAGTPASVKCSFRVFFSGMENVSAFLKGALIVLVINVASFFGIIVGYFPVFLSLVMAPFYLAVKPQTSVREALSKSRKLMKGHKKEAFSVILEFVILQVVASLFSFFGMGLFSTLLEVTSQSMLYTCLAVIFVQLDRSKNEEKEDA